MYRNTPILRFFAGFFAVLIGFAVLSLILFVRARPILHEAAKKQAQTILLDAANQATAEFFCQSEWDYAAVSAVSRDAEGQFCGIEINSAKINLFKSDIARRISEILSARDEFFVSIPFGTLLGSEYTTGFGPKFRIPIQVSQTANVDFESEFSDAGINQVLHRITVNIDLQGSVLMVGYADGFSVKTAQIAAETVIVGRVPDSFTQVIEEPGDDVADELFNYADLD